MSYTRKFQRSHEQHGGIKAENRTWTRSVIAAAAAAGLALNPAAVFAANIITKADGTQLNAVNNLTKIYADKIVGDAAVNTFKDFRVEANNIVNMYFKTAADADVESKNLVNFVNSRVIIDGTVNSVYNNKIDGNKIGGNLYFLSTDGFVMGKSGVINAGSLYVATPSSEFMKNYQKYADDNDNVNFNTMFTEWSAMPLNNSGTISVLGKINTVDGINMRAAQITIGEGVAGEKDSSAVLCSESTIDFSNLVNISGSNINAELGTDLVAAASADASGDIVLTAWADTVNGDDENWDHNSAQNLVHAKVESHGAIKSRGKVDISATATNGVAYSTVFGDKEIGSGGTALDFWGQMVKTKAEVQIDGEVTAAGDVNIKAHTGNYYVSDISEDAISGNTKIEGATNPFHYTQWLNTLIGTIGPNMDAAYAVLGGEATVTVGKYAIITGNDLDIMADSVVRTGVGASTAAFKLTNLKGSNKLPGMAITVANIKNEASVTIDGELHASGNTNIAAKADTTLEAVASGALSWQFSGAPTLVDMAILEADGDTSSKVTVNNAVDAAGDVTIKAATLSSVDTEAVASSLEQSIASTAINVTLYDSSADVIINDAVKGENVTITADNSMRKNTVTADNAVGSAFFLNELIELGQGSVAVQSGVDFFGGLSKKVFGESSPGSTKLDELGQLISIGASVAVADESSRANVLLSKGAVARANNGDVKITASNIIDDTWMHAVGATSNYHNEDATNDVLVNASVLYAKMDNQAGVVLEGGDSHNAEGAQYTQLQGNSVSVTADSRFNYNRVNNMIKELLDLCAQIEKAYTGSTAAAGDTDTGTAGAVVDSAKIAKVVELAGEYKAKIDQQGPDYAISDEGAQDAVALAKAAKALADEVSAVEASANKESEVQASATEESTDESLPERIETAIFGPFSVAGMLMEFADPNNYVNFQAGSSTGGKDVSKEGAELAVSGSANVNELSNTAQVIVGKNSVITGAGGAVNLDAKVVQHDAALSGKLGYSSGGDIGVGGLAGLQWSDTNSLVAVAEGAQITAGSLNVNAANDVLRTSVAFGAGMYGKVGLAGMASYLEGSSNSLVSIDDEAVLSANGAIKLAANNDTIVTNVAGGGVMGDMVSMSAGVAINAYNINSMVVIGDNDLAGSTGEASGSSAAEDNAAANGDLTAESIFGSGESDAAAKMRELLAENALADAATLFGSKESDNAGKITAQSLDVNSKNGSVVNSAAVAGSIMTGSDGNAGVIDKTINWGTNKVHALFNQVRVLDQKLNSKLTGSSNLAYHAPTNTQATNRTKDMPLPKLTLSAAGSVAANVIEGSTAAVLDGVEVGLTSAAPDKASLSVKAEDAAFTGAWSGAGAISYKTLSTSQNENNVNMGIAGSVAVNAANTEALALIKDSEITDADSIVNEAQKRGALVAAGLGLVGEITSGGGGVNIAANADASVNAADNKVQALMLNNTVSSVVPTNITNIAYDDDTQLTGGVDLELAFGGKGGAAIGGTLGYGDIDNTVEARISDGKYVNAGVVDVQAVTDITQIGVGVGANIIHASSGSVSGEGVAVYNSLDNNVQAVIENAAITAQQVGVQAYDSDGAALGAQTGDDETVVSAKNYDKYISDRGLDPTGASYLREFYNTAETPNAESSQNAYVNTTETPNDESSQNAYVLNNPDANGNMIITGALSVGINASKGAGLGAAVTVNDINNDFNAAITGSVITAGGAAAAQDVLVNAKSDTLMLGAAAGSAIGATTSTDLSVAGSVTWQNLDNDVTASINGSNITAGSTAVQAATESIAVNVTGQVSLGSVAAGLALAQTSVENTTGAYVKNSTITANTYDADGAVSEVKPGALEVTAQNSGQQYTVAAGVGVSTGYAAVNGTVTVNLGHNNVEAVVDTSTLKNMRSVGVRTLDESILASTAGGVGAGKYAAMGGSVAYNQVGSLSGSDDEKKQLNRAQINNTVITTADAGEIEVAAQDEALLVTGAIGVGITGSSSAALAAEGAAATALLNKATEASLNATVITAYEQNNTKADVSVTAASSSSSITTADVASVTGSGEASISVGAGVAVSRSEADTLALVSGGKQAVQNLNVLAQSNILIDTVGVGGSAAIAGEGAGVAVQGNVAVNLIGNDTRAKISGGADITADNNVGVVALSDEIINNYAGSAAIGGSATAGVGVGVSVSVNEINGSTTAAIGDENDKEKTRVTALALDKSEALTTKTVVAEGEINDTLIDSKTVDITAKIDRSAETRHGIVVDASATHDIKSFLVNAAAGAGVGVAGVTGTVNVNSIGGATSASVSNAVLRSTSSYDDEGIYGVSIKAGDYTNSAGFVGSVGGGIGIGAGAGLGSDTHLVRRSVLAQAVDSDIAAHNFSLDAVSRQGVSSFTLGLGIGGVGLGAAGVVSVVQLENTTRALVDGVTIDAASAVINAGHKAMTNAGTVSAGEGALGVGVGFSVGVLQDNSVTEALVGGSDSQSNDKATVIETDGDISVQAHNYTSVRPVISANAIGAGGLTGAVSVNNINSKVRTAVDKACLDAAGSIKADANNIIDVNAYIGENTGSIIGVGSNVTVNTIDSTVQTTVNDSDLTAGKNINVTAGEDRRIKQLATNAALQGVGATVNIAITNVGKEIRVDEGEEDVNLQAVVDAINQANAAYEVQDKATGSTYTFNPFGSSNTTDNEKWYDYDYTLGALELAGSSVTNPAVKAGFGEDGASQITVNIISSEIAAGDTFTAESKETDDVKMTLGSGEAALAAVNAGVGLLNVHRNVGVKLDDAQVTAVNTANIGSVVKDSETNGGVKLNVYQGTGGLIGLSAAYGGAATEGFSRIDVADSAISGKRVNISASDSGTTSVDSLGIMGGAIVSGAIVSEADNSSDTSVTISGTQITGTAQAADKDAAVTVKAEKNNTVTAHATGGAGGAASGTAVAATAGDKGSAMVTVQNGSTLTADELTLQAVNKPAVKAVADSLAVTLADTVGTAVALADASGSAGVTVGNSSNITGVNKLLADTVNINAFAGAQEGKNTVEAQAEGNNGAGLIDVSANAATATAEMSVDITISDTEYKTEIDKAVDGTVYNEETGIFEQVTHDVITGATQLNISGVNASSATADARGVSVAGIFASGENIAKATNTPKINISLNGGDAGGAALLRGLQITASGAAANTVTADGSGGALVNGDLAAWVTSTIDSNINTTLNGSFKVAGDVLLSSQQEDKAELNADALKATVLGGSATKADNEITGSNVIAFEDAAIESGGAITAEAANTLVMGEQYKYAVEGSGYGGATVQGAQYDNTIDKAAAVNLTGADLVSDGAQALSAQTAGSIAAGGYIKAAGAGAFTWVDVDNDIAVDNSVNVESGSSMKTRKAEQDITLAAVDTLNIAVTALADTQGAAVGGASADLDNTLRRSNSVNAAGELYSMHDVNLYAGRDKDAKDGRLELALESEAYNKTTLGLAVPKLANSMEQSNSVTVDADAKISSVRNINLYADAGVENVRETDIMYNWYYSEGNDSFTSSTMGQVSPNKTADNFVQVNGSLTAGVQNKQYITIGTAPGQLVFADDEVLEAVNNYGNGQEKAISVSELLNSEQLRLSENVAKDSITVGTMDYGLELFKRYCELGQLMSDYSERYTGDDTAKNYTEAYLGYKAERERVLAEMESLGLVQEATTENGATVKIPVTGMKIDYISLPDIVASGGNINIQTDTLSGSSSGSLKAQGNPEVTITNNTNLYMKVNDVLVGDSGGAITYNNVHLTAENYTSEVDRLNSDNSKEVSFSLAEDTSADWDKINISGNYGGAPVYANVSGKMTDPTTDSGVEIEGSGTVSLIPKADIEINGNVISQNGVVTVTSAANDIVIRGATADSSASVQGKEVHLTAAKGSISQSYQDGIVNIGGEVQKQYEQQYEQAKQDFKDQYDSVLNGSNAETTHDEKYIDDIEITAGNKVAGENIYINALDININGYMQSGYAKYLATVDEKAVEAIKTLQSKWEQQGRQDLSDAVVTSGSEYRIVTGHSDGTSYIVDLYYNPSTGKIIVPDIDAQGGRIYLTGRISSTGGGSINVLDGAYDITVYNSTDKDLQLGKLVSNNVKGLISITDTAKNTLTEIYRDRTEVTNLLTNIKETPVYRYGDGSDSTTYEPQEGLRYNWTTGQETVTTETYEDVHKAGLWGLVETMDEQTLVEFEEAHPQDPSAEKLSYKKNGEYIGIVSGLDNDSNFAVIFDNIVVEQERTTPTSETWSSGFLNWYKWEKVTWTVKTGTTQQYFGSVKADNAIDINFFGNKNGNAAISVNSGGGVDLKGNIKTTSNDASVITIISNSGAINGSGGALTSDSIMLSAQTGINDLTLNSWSGTVNLGAINTDSGNITIGVGDTSGVALSKLSTNSGTVSLKAYGDITKQDVNATVKGNRIDLVSSNGGIGTSAQALTVQGGQAITDTMDSLSASVNASAYGDIYLTQDVGDLRAGRIYSENGDVVITVADGDLIDALPAGETLNRGDESALLRKWSNLGLIAGENGISAEQAVADYKDSITNSFAAYKKLEAYYEQNLNVEPTESYKAMQVIYGGYETADAYLDAYLAGTDSQAYVADLEKNNGGIWNQTQLLYAFQDNIMNPKADATDTVVKDPNIKGRNITLKAENGGVGMDSIENVTVKLEGLYDNLEGLKALAGADAASITWDEVNKQFVISQKYPIGVQLLNDGKLNVTAKDNIYLAGRTVNNASDTNALNIELLKSANGNIRLQGHDGIYNVRTDESAAIIGKDLLIQAGYGDIGGVAAESDGYMNVQLSGVLQAQAAGHIAIHQLSEDTLKVASMGAGTGIDLLAAEDIISYDTEYTGVQNYIKSDSGVINIVSENGSVGSAEDEPDAELRIHNTNDSTQLVNVTAAKDVNLQGVSLAENTPAGSLFLGTVQADGQVEINVNGDAMVSAVVDENNDPTGGITASQTVTITAQNNAVVNNTVYAGDKITVSAQNNAEINNVLTATGENGTVEVKAGTDAVISGEVTAKDAITVNAQNNAEINNALTATGENSTVEVKAGTDAVITGDIEAGGAVNIIAGSEGTEGSAVISGAVTAKDAITVSAKNNAEINNALTATGANGTVDITAGTDTVINGVVTAENAITVSAQNNAEINNVLTATGETGTVDITAGTDAVINEAVDEEGNPTGGITASQTVTITAQNNAVVNNTVDAGDKITVNAKNNAEINNTLTATGENGTVDVTAGRNAVVAGNVDAGGVVTITAQGNVSAGEEETEAQGNVTVSGTVDAGGAVNIIAGSEGIEGSAVISGAVTASDTITVQAKENAEINDKLTATGANGTVDVTAGTDAVITGDVDAGGAVNIIAGNESTEGSAVISGAVTAKDAITVNAQNNAEINNMLTATGVNGTVDVTAGTDAVINGVLTAENAITVSVQNNAEINNVLTATGANGTVEVNAGTDAVINGAVDESGNPVGGITAKGTVTITAQNDAVVNNTVDAGDKITVSAQNNAEINNVLTATGETSTVEVTAGNDAVISGAVTASDTITVQAKEKAEINNTLTATGENGTVDVTAGTDAVINGVLAAEKDVTLDAANDLIINNDITAGNEQNAASVIMLAGGDVLLNKGTLTASSVYMPEDSDGKIGGAIVQKNGHSIAADKLYAAAVDGITLAGDNNALHNVDLWNAGQGAISLTNNGAQTLNVIIENNSDGNGSNKGITILNKNNGNGSSDVNILTTLEATGDIVVTNEAGNVQLASGDTAAEVKGYYTGLQNIDKAAEADGSIAISSNGSIISDSQLTAGKNIVLDAEEAISLASDVSAGNDVKLQAGSEIIAEGDVSAGNDVTAKAAKDIEFGGTINAEAGSIAVASENGDIDFGSSVNAKEDISVSTGTGDITLTDNVSAGQDIALQTKNGGIKVSGEVDSGRDISVHTEAGNITLEENVSAGQNVGLKTTVGDIDISKKVTSENGNINVLITEQGNIGNAQGSLESINGSVNVVNIGTGDVDLDEIYALDNARVGLANGNLRLTEINGNLVAIVLRTEGKKMDIENIVAAAQVIVRGSDMNLDDIEQRIDGDGMLVITPGGTALDKPIDNFEIGDIETNGTSGIRIERLWVNNANVATDEGKLFIDKLFVEDKALFTNNGMVTSVYGTAPVWDGSNSVYWQNTTERRPEQNLNSWLRGPSGEGSGWMYLNFAERSGMQYSNGLLVHLQDHYYVYDQRFSGVGHLRYLNGDVLNGGYELEHIPGLSHYNRYNNYELPEIVAHAAEDELVIE